MLTPLTEDEIAAALKELPEWSVVDGRLSTTRKLPTFLDALAWVQKVGLVAEDLNHHPDITIKWKLVTVTCCTHDAHNQITKFDTRLAERIDALG
jgi:4a-hydroxytetrahydrobiopterin dehydratase